PDYSDLQPGSSAPGRTVIAELFDANELGPWKTRLRPGFINLPAAMSEIQQLPHLKYSWKVKLIAAKVAFRALVAKLTGKQFVTAGAALQGRMLQAALKAGVDIRTD